jgi:hypothetical protein
VFNNQLIKIIVDTQEQNSLLAKTIEMVMTCLHHHQDEAVKQTCRQFLMAYAFAEDDDEIEQTDEVEQDDEITDDDGSYLGSRYFDRADDEYESNRDDKYM